MTIHSTHPFAMPEDAARRLRGRLGGTVSLWTAGSGATRAGLTVSSLMVATGAPAYVVGLLDPDSDLFDALETTERGVVQLLRWRHRELAEMFAGATPAPGGVFRQAEFDESAWGPVLADATTWAGVVLESVVEVGWSMQVTCRIEHVVLGEEPDPLVHRRGRYVPMA
ncbi:flavin reductase family protein [Nocardioides jejuensis]|uniref:Flavin reductase n=1 Tax=Nocardioides jejuensis TaxID=2502782 RepID=A0A4R1C1W3_9ACTN|nr:flavin reductase family protein [Nocardioides jejuensis]TCJ23705.1 flavin reductase [Nocardioides jejuensis]